MRTSHLSAIIAPETGYRFGQHERGDRAVVHGLRGRASNRKISAAVQARAIKILKQPDWHDFGPTFAAEQLAQRHEIQVSEETLRRWMREAGLWKGRPRHLDEVHCWRPRRGAFGELVQWDTSEHDWLEGRGPVRYLVRFIDDATTWSWVRFVERDATPQNMAVLWGVSGKERAHAGHFDSFHASGLRLSRGTFYFGQLGTSHFGATIVKVTVSK